MITENYVSFETAKLLKEKGFDAAVNYYYNKDGSEMCSIPSYNWNDGPFYSKCTLQMAMKWLREKHKIFFNVNYFQLNVGNEWLQLTINLPNKNGCEISFEGFDLEEIYEKAVKYCLENLI